MKKSAFLLLMAVASSVNAANTFVKIKDYTVWSNTYSSDDIRVSDVTVKNPDECTDPDSYFVASGLSADSKNRIYSALLAAAIADEEITIVINGCQQNRPAILSVLVH